MKVYCCTNCEWGASADYGPCILIVAHDDNAPITCPYDGDGDAAWTLRVAE